MADSAPRPTMPAPFTLVLVAATLVSLALHVWLTLRHRGHVLRHRSLVPSAFAEEVPLDAHQKAADYTAAKAGLHVADTLLSHALILAWTVGGGIQTLGVWLGHIAPQGSLLHGTLWVGAYAVIGGVVGLPLALLRTFGVEQQFGFNRMTAAMYTADLLKQALLGIAIGSPVIAAILWLMDSAGPLWWLYAWLLWAGFNLLVLLLYPVFIAPLFNRFEPLADESLRGRIEALLERCGFRASGLFVMDGSRRSGHGNAYFTGFGRSKRIVFFDTLLDKLSPEEVEAVLAHELGHFKLRHVWKRMALLFAGSFLFLAILGEAYKADWFYAGLGVTQASPAAALLLFLTVIPVFTFPLSPLLHGLSRKHEFEADAYAVSNTRATDLRSALVRLYRENAATLTPDPIYSLWHDSHPPAIQRIARLNRA